MSINYPQTFDDPHHDRQFRNVSLDFFLTNYIDPLDGPVKTMMETLISELKKRDIEAKNEYKEKERTFVSAQDDQDAFQAQEILYIQYEVDREMDKEFTNDQLLALAEIKIIHQYKRFEIWLKQLIRLGYPRSGDFKSYKWVDFVNFFKSRSIALSKLDGYQEVDQLREVNNMLKHTDLLNERVRSYPEFLDKNELTTDALLAFYERVKHAPETFLESIARQIQIDLYSFDMDRMNAMADDLVARMDPEVAKDFAALLLSKYSAKK